MKRIAILSALCVACCLPTPARADDLAAAANALLAAQLADAVSTRALLRQPGAFERDPLARPFVRSDVTAIGAAVVANFIARAIFRHRPATMRVFAGIVAVAVGNNVRGILR